MCSISKLTFTRFNFFKFPLILQNALAIRNQRYMNTPVETQAGQFSVEIGEGTQFTRRISSLVFMIKCLLPWFACCTYYYNCIIYHPPALEINGSKLQSTFFVHCVPTQQTSPEQPFYWMNKPGPTCHSSSQTAALKCEIFSFESIGKKMMKKVPSLVCLFMTNLNCVWIQLNIPVENLENKHTKQHKSFLIHWLRIIERITEYWNKSLNDFPGVCQNDNFIHCFSTKLSQVNYFQFWQSQSRY